MSAPTSWPGAASPWRCRFGARSSTRSTSSRIQASAVRLELHVSSGTYVRASPRPSAGTARACGAPRSARSGSRRPTPSGCSPVSDVLARLPEEALARVPDGGARRRAADGGAPVEAARVKVARTPGGARAAAARGRDRHVRRRPPRPPRGARRDAGGRAACRRPSPSIRTRASCSATRSTCSARSSGGSSCSRRPGWRRRSWSSSRPRSPTLEPAAFVGEYLAALGAEIVVAGEGFRFGRLSGGDLDTIRRARASRRRPCRSSTGVSSTRIRTLAQAGDVGEAAGLLGRPFELDGIVVTGDQRGGTLGFPTANLRVAPELLVPAFGIYAGAVGDRRAAVSIGVNPHYGGSERRIEAFLLDWQGDLYGNRLVARALAQAARRARLRERGRARRPDRRATSPRRAPSNGPV